MVSGTIPSLRAKAIEEGGVEVGGQGMIWVVYTVSTSASSSSSTPVIVIVGWAKISCTRFPRALSTEVVVLVKEVLRVGPAVKLACATNDESAAAISCGMVVVVGVTDAKQPADKNIHNIEPAFNRILAGYLGSMSRPTSAASGFTSQCRTVMGPGPIKFQDLLKVYRIMDQSEQGQIRACGAVFNCLWRPV